MRIARLTFFLFLILCTFPCAAQTVDSTEDTFALSQGADVPPFVVPVLRLVSKTHVEPTTGIVLSQSGLVLVPGGFASTGDEIVVLDGGTDIVANGRTARVEKNFPMDGLQVLAVYGLRREGAPFADGGLGDGDTVRLSAFPPAERIAEGAPPLDVPATVTVFGGNNTPAVSGETPLPNVSGPLLDDCGNVAAFSIAHDIQTMETTPGTRYQWRETLLGIMETLGLRPGPSACAAEFPAAEPEPEPEAAQAPEASAPEPAEPEPGPVIAEEGPGEESEGEELPPVEESPPEILPPIETPDDSVEQPVAEEPSGGWAWLLLAAVLIAAGIGLHRWRRSNGAADAGDEPVDDVPPPVGEDAAGFDEPVPDSVLALRGQLRDGQPVDVTCPVSSHAINVVIGRGGSDLQIRSAAVSRRHASLNGTADNLTITDLGSNNGTTINGVPCLEGEIMYVEAGDTITLGDARFTIDLEPAGDVK